MCAAAGALFDLVANKVKQNWISQSRNSFHFSFSLSFVLSSSSGDGENAQRTNLYQPPALFLSAPLCIQLALLKWRSKSFSLSQGGRCYCWMPENIYSLILLHSSWLNTCCRHCYIPAIFFPTPLRLRLSQQLLVYFTSAPHPLD